MSKQYTEDDPTSKIVATAVKGKPVGFCEDTALSLAERTFSTEVDEHLAEDVIQFAQRLYSLYSAQQQENNALLKDKARLDWLADVNNNIGNVLLPRDIVERNLGSLRAGIDEAMKL